MVNSLSVSRLESKRDRGKKGGAFRSKLMRGLALHRPHTLPPIPPNGLLGWKEMPPAVSPVTQNGLVLPPWLPLRIVLRGANAATRAHVARVCACDKTRRDEKRRRSRRLLFLLPRPRRELASVLAPTTRRAPLREMAPPRSRRRDQPRASGERRSAATMRRDVCNHFSF